MRGRRHLPPGVRGLLTGRSASIPIIPAFPSGPRDSCVLTAQALASPSLRARAELTRRSSHLPGAQLPRRSRTTGPAHVSKHWLLETGAPPTKPWGLGGGDFSSHRSLAALGFEGTEGEGTGGPRHGPGTQRLPRPGPSPRSSLSRSGPRGALRNPGRDPELRGRSHRRAFS